MSESKSKAIQDYTAKNIMRDIASLIRIYFTSIWAFMTLNLLILITHYSAAIIIKYKPTFFKNNFDIFYLHYCILFICTGLLSYLLKRRNRMKNFSKATLDSIYPTVQKPKDKK